MYTPPGMRAASVYRRVATESAVPHASPHHLVTVLFDGLISSLNVARGAIDRGDVAAKGAAILKATRIIEEGLKGALDVQRGGQLAANLKDLYEFSVRRITEANIRNDRKALQDVLATIEPIASAWREIAPKGV